MDGADLLNFIIICGTDSVVYGGSLRLVRDATDEYERSMARIHDVLSKMTTLLNASTATASSAMYSRQCIMRGSHGVEDNYNTTMQSRDIIASYINLTSAFSAITFNIRTGP